MKRLLPVLAAFVVAFLAVGAFFFLTRDDGDDVGPADASPPVNPDGSLPEVDPCDAPPPAAAPEPEPGSFEEDQVVAIRDGELFPDELTAAVGHAVTFRNETDAEQCVQFTNFSSLDGSPIISGPIPAGGSWAYVPESAGSVVYRTSDGVEGTLQLEPVVEG